MSPAIPPAPSSPNAPSRSQPAGLRQIDVTAGAKALAAMELVRGVARIVCAVAVPVSAFVAVGEVHARVPLENRLLIWLVLTAALWLPARLGFSYAIGAMRPLAGLLTLAAAAGPALWALAHYAASIGSWQEKWREHLPVLLILLVLVWPLLAAWLRVARLEPEVRGLARSAPPLSGWGDLWRETFSVWPGVRRARMQAALSTVFSYLSALVLWVGVLILTPCAVVVLLLLPLLASTKGTLEVAGPLLIILALFFLLIFLQNALRTLARWSSRAALADKVEQDPRPPVLFLRSFQDDQVRLPERSPLASFYRRILTLGLGWPRLDHELVERFSRYGPALALGNPGEKSLPFGAARVYATHERWQEVVRELAARSAHVVLVADSTPGVEWEIQTFQQPPLVDKTAFLCAPRAGDLRESPPLARWLEEAGLPAGGRPVLAAFQDLEGSLVLLRCAHPRPSSAYVVAMQAFFRLRSPSLSARN